jgi:hypothetical protein
MKRLVLVLPLLFGCQHRIETETHTFSYTKPSRIVSIVIDMSGSFQQLMADNGAAWQFVLLVIDTYFKNSIGSDDRLIISQISGATPLLWEGRPLDLRRDFPTPGSFRDFLKSKSTDGSPIHLAVARSLEYEMSVSDPTTKAAMFVLSDMEDNGEKTEAMKTRILAALSKFAQQGGAIGLYYVSDPYIEPWKKILQDSGFKEWRVESQIVSHPLLPNLEE